MLSAGMAWRRRNWSREQKRFGPFTYSRDRDWRPISAVLDSGHNESPGCHLRLRAFGHTLLIELPQIVKPWRQWVDTSRYEWSGPSKGYMDEHAREYGFTLSEGHFMVYLGAQTHDSTTTQSWSCFLPWTQWRHVRRSLYDAEGRHFWTDWDRRGELCAHWEAKRAVVNACPTVKFLLDDYDGERITATTRIEEREWRFGTGWFRWLSWFRNPSVRRSLEISFSAEVGPEKGSWKGGTVGHGIDMLPGELHEAAFRRYCEQEHRAKGSKFRLTFVGPA